jgi:hypothetical protein
MRHERPEPQQLLAPYSNVVVLKRPLTASLHTCARELDVRTIGPPAAPLTAAGVGATGTSRSG